MIRHCKRSIRRFMLEAINLGCARGSRRLFRNLNFAVTEGSCVLLQGANGTGKTSLLRIICGLLEPTEGELRWTGSSTRSLGDDYRQALAYVGHRNGLKDELTPIENLRAARGLHGTELSIDEARAALEKMGLSAEANLPTRFLSAGQRKRAALARLLVSPAKLWLLDEATTSLDASGAKIAEAMISAHLGNGGIAVVATHQDLTFSAGSTQRIQLGE
jgi:heme exporter protein A